MPQDRRTARFVAAVATGLAGVAAGYTVMRCLGASRRDRGGRSAHEPDSGATGIVRDGAGRASTSGGGPQTVGSSSDSGPAPLASSSVGSGGGSRRGVVVVGTTKSGRLLQLARLGSQTGRSLAMHRARRIFADAEQRRELDARFELQTAEQVAQALGNMKGALMKLGQMASYLDHGLPAPVREALSQLQSDAPPMSGELAASCIRTELGADPGDVFHTWDPVPIASASIGQVHRAITRDGRAVAVKVQYPGVGDAIRSDLASAGLVFGGLGMMFPGLEPGPLVAELRARLAEETDYRLEARNQQLFADYFDGHPSISVPRVVHELSTGKVLTTELAEGARYDELLTWPQEELDLAAETIFRFVFRSLYRLHAFNGDPHPGNYLFQRGGRVTFLDFGLVKHFAEDETVVFSRMVKAMVIDHDAAEFRRIIESVGLLRPGEPFTDEEVEDYFGHFYEFVLTDGPVTMTPDYAAESVRRMFDARGPHGEIMKAANVPPSFVIIQRINMGLYALLGDLHATRNWRRIAEELWPFVDGVPSTPLGNAESNWRKRTGR
jgi:predicted unusual protein kinase regulating ubiquinone biosynthesis (AarF/ABC1/UbiB family)